MPPRLKKGDPLFCDPLQHVYTLHSGSPCLPLMNPAGVRIGAGRFGYCGPVSGVEEPTASSIRLQPPVPNPSRGQAELQYYLPTQSEVTLRIYSVSGREVLTIHDGAPQAAGAHVARWDGLDETGRRAASGIYLCRLEVGGEARGQTIVRLK